MREWLDIHAQITDILKVSGNVAESLQLKKQTKKMSGIFKEKYTAIHKSILSGFLSNIAVKKEGNHFKAGKNRNIMIFPGSSLFNNSGTWVVAAEMIETSRLFARKVARIDQHWLEALAINLCKYSYHTPHWKRSRGDVVAFEQVTLFGLIIIERREVSFGKINPVESTEIFIQNALIQGDVRSFLLEKRFPFLKHNLLLMEKVRKLENKIRQKNILVNEDEILEFYQKRLSDVYSIVSLEHHIRKKRSDEHLFMNISDLVQYTPDENALAQYPDKIPLGNRIFPCEYNFEPGKDKDGVTVTVSKTDISSIDPNRIDWLVPGLYREKITALIKGLPKEYRKQLVPVVSTVDTIITKMPKGGKALLSVLGDFIFEHYKINIPSSAWPDDILPDHLRMRISITDDQGKVIDCSRNKEILSQFSSSVQEDNSFKKARAKWEKTDITTWNFGDLPSSVLISESKESKIIGYLGLEQKNKDPVQINLHLFHSIDNAIKSHVRGVAALLSNHFKKDLKYLKKHLSFPPDIKNKAVSLGGEKQLLEMVYKKVIDRLFCRDIRTRGDFFTYITSVSPIILQTGTHILNSALPIIKYFHEAKTGLYELQMQNQFNSDITGLLIDLESELSKLVPETFLTLYHDENLIHIPRYIRTIFQRARRAVVDFEKDRAKASVITPYSDKLNVLLDRITSHTTLEKKKSIEEYFWMLEEFKVSIFAQELKTAIPVSTNRLDDKLLAIERMV